MPVKKANVEDENDPNALAKKLGLDIETLEEAKKLQAEKNKKKKSKAELEQEVRLRLRLSISNL